eukprot:2620_1
MEHEKEDADKNSDMRSESVADAHRQWLADNIAFYAVFKHQKCKKGAECISGINCIDYHTPNDRRRIQFINKYSHQACPNVWDFKKKTFIENKICNKGDNCEYAHNFYEAW